MGAMETTERPLTLVSLTESAATKIRDLMAEEAEGEAAVLRHEHRCLDARLARGPRDRLPVIPRARGDDAGTPFRLGQRRQLVGGAPDLERARALKILGLQRDLAPGYPRERLGAVHRRHAHDALEPRSRLFDVAQARSGLSRQP